MAAASDDLGSLQAPWRFGAHTVPGVWRYMLPPDILAMQPPAEQRASCSRCPMVALDGFRPDYRCCTYHPLVPNFLLGLALDDRLARDAIERAVALGYVTPEGAQPSPAQRLAAQGQTLRGEYGKGSAALCHFLEPKTGHCKIHAFRNSVCATFFCVHEHGARGTDFWEAMECLVGQAETALAQWALESNGFDLGAYLERLDGLALAPLSACDATHGAWTPEAQRELWGDWYGRELELLRACAQSIVKERHSLRTIVARSHVKEPEHYERAIAALFAKLPGSEASPAPLADDGAYGVAPAGAPSHAPIGAYIERVREAYSALRALPREGSLLMLNPCAKITVNPMLDAGDRHYEQCPAKLRFAANSQAVWELHLSTDEAEALSYFLVPRRLEAALWDAQALRPLSDVHDFISRWLGHEVLIECGRERVQEPPF